MPVVRTRGRARRWDYVPLGTASLSMLLLLAVLPSALNLPQTDPSETLEYAPVPPEDDTPPSPEGNFSALGLGSTRSLGQGGPGPGLTAEVDGAGLVGVGKNPSTKRCVGRPPRQTADPMAPPCVAYFNGDNGGATAKGVSRDEVLVLVYIDAYEFSAGLACHNEGCDYDAYYDLGKPPSESSDAGHDEQEAYWPHVWRTWQRYFNDRYQTYGRFVHLWVHFGSLVDTPEARRADVADAAARLEPFAVLADVVTNGEVYAEEWARRDKVVIMTKTSTEVDEMGFDARSLQRYAGRLWSYTPSVQQRADNYGSFLCAQVVGHPVSFAGDGTNGQPRKLGMLRTNNPNDQNWIDYARLITSHLERCGADIVSDHDYDNERSEGSSTAADAGRIAALMRQDGVTTIVYLSRGPSAPGFSHAVGAQPGWRPEWLVQMDNTAAINAYEEPTVFRHARNFSIWPRASRGADRRCEQAFLEAEPTGSAFAEASLVCYTFNDARMLFTGIQVAGPRLTWNSLDKGMHAIPAIPSGDPKVPACFYETGDYTCVKDAQVQWWDPTGRMDRASQPGCWRSIDGGQRYLEGDWPVRDVDTVRRPAEDGCNIQGAYA